MLLRTFYVSRRDPGATAGDVQRILFVSRIKNRRLDITGVLAEFDGYFAQVLEGHAAVVDELLDRIRRDVRHREMRILFREEIQDREYANWHMAAVARPQYVAAIRDLHAGSASAHDEVATLVRQLMQLDDRPPWQA